MRVEACRDAGEDETAARALRTAGLAVTPPRHAVYRVLAGRDRLVSAGDVFDLVRAGGSRLALASVYRVLHIFVAAGIVHVFAGEENRFRMCASAPHAHLVCERCGLVIERPAEVVRGWLVPATRGVDFEPTVERSDVYGRCGNCRHHAK
jgi:Fe2+ or Zn2+ uptake regulation protein